MNEIKKILLIVLLLFAYNCNTYQEANLVEIHNIIYDEADENPYYGENDYIDFMRDLIVFNKHLKNIKGADIPTKIKIQFVVTSEGRVVNASIVGKKDVEYTEFDKALIKRVESEEMNKWRPAKINGLNINYRNIITINLNIRR